MTHPIKCNDLSHCKSPPSAWLLLAPAAVILIIFRIHAFDLPLETDECNYAYTAARLLQGDRLYVDVWDHQPPGVFVLFAAVISVFGSSDAVLRWTAIVFSLASLTIIHHIVRRHFSPVAAVVAAIIFAVVSSDPGTAGEGCNREIYMNFCALAALALMTAQPHRRSRILLAGACLALGSTLKTVVAAQWLLLTIWLAAHRYATTRRVRPALQAVLDMAVAPAAIWAALLIYFTATERAQLFIDAVFTYNIGYGGLDRSLLGRLTGFLNPVSHVFQSAAPLWYAAAVALPALCIMNRRKLTTAHGAVIAYAAGSFIALCLPGRYYPHYYYLLIPPNVLLCTALIASLMQRIRSTGAKRVTLTAALAWTATLLVFQLTHYLLVQPDRITAPHPIYRYRQAWSRAQGERIAQLTDPEDTIFVWGLDAGFYYYAHRRCASRYTMVGGLADDARGASDRRRILLDELAAAKPRLVLIVQPEFPELKAFLNSRYVLAGPSPLDRHDFRPEKIIMVALMDPNRPVKPIDWEWSMRK
ncbi:MAG: glycosyltransferase family 39 protein [Phycisphaerae bacterium]